MREVHDGRRVRRRAKCAVCRRDFASRRRMEEHVCPGRDRTRRRTVLVRDVEYDDLRLTKKDMQKWATFFVLFGQPRTH